MRGTDPARAYATLARRLRAVGRALTGRDAPDDPEPVDAYEILEAVARLPVSTWSYSWDPGSRHLAPMAQDFRAAFGLGHSDRRIHPMDLGGVCLVAIQALQRNVDALEAEVQVLRRAGNT